MSCEPNIASREPSALPSPSRRAALFALVGAALGLSACTVSPLYGTRPGAVPLGLVSVKEVRTRVAQRVRNALIETLGPPSVAEPFTLTLDVGSRVRFFLTDAETNRTSAGTVTVTAAFSLRAPDGTVQQGRERARASFDAPLQEFARQRAVRDAEDRAAREAAQRVRLAIAPALAGGRVAPSDLVVPEQPERDPAR